MDKKLTVNELIKLLDDYEYKEIHIHHTWKPDHDDFTGDNHLRLQQAMRNYHMNSLGWNDIGQHVSLFPDGIFVTGRDFSKIPASIRGHNTGAFAVEMIGNFDVGHDNLEGEQKVSILKLARLFVEQGKYIRFHRENAQKTCPGSSIDKVNFMKQVMDLEKIGHVSIIYNGKKINGFIINGISYAPVRDLSEVFGLNVGWNSKLKTVELVDIKKCE